MTIQDEIVAAAVFVCESLFVDSRDRYTWKELLIQEQFNYRWKPEDLILDVTMSRSSDNDPMRPISRMLVKAARRELDNF